MSKRAGYKRYDELAAWDLDASCRRWINQASPSNRKLKKKLRRQVRKRLDKVLWHCYNIPVRKRKEGTPNV